MRRKPRSCEKKTTTNTWRFFAAMPPAKSPMPHDTEHARPEAAPGSTGAGSAGAADEP
jgi:hypothetical protein